MAVDTRQKRMSIMSMRQVSLSFAPLFESDGAVDLDDRQHLLNRYSGIAFGAAVVSPKTTGPTGNVGVRRTVAGTVGVRRTVRGNIPVR